MNEFQKARLKLTFWYVLIIFFLLAVFSFAAISAEQAAFNRIIQSLNNRPLHSFRSSIFQSALENFERNFRRRLFIFDGILFIIASFASYFLSGITLNPIQDMIKKQEDFAADASHELRTPLATIGMEIEALRRTETKIPKKYQSLFESIREETDRMKSIVDGLLTIVRYNSDNFQKIRKKFDLRSVCEESFSQMEKLAKQKDLHYDLIQSKDPLSVHADRDQIKQVLLIFLDNAIKYTPSGGSIEVSSMKTKNQCRIEVTDTGVGISLPDQKQVFERFYRVGSKSSGEGSGLGLSIAKQIVQLHNGFVGVKSESGKGATFYFELPYAV